MYVVWDGEERRHAGDGHGGVGSVSTAGCENGGGSEFFIGFRKGGNYGEGVESGASDAEDFGGFGAMVSAGVIVV